MSKDLTRGDRTDAVAIFVNILVRLGFLNQETDNFDAVVEEAVKAFQQERGLKVTGVIDQVTSRALEEARYKLGDRVLALNSTALMHGDDVSNLQSRLVEMGFNCGKIEGVYGLLTDLAVKEFQKSVGGVVDGKCGTRTLIALRR